MKQHSLSRKAITALLAGVIWWGNLDNHVCAAENNNLKGGKMSLNPVDIMVSGQVIGEIKKLNGGNMAPPLTDEMAGCNIRKSFADLNIPITRLHDASIENSALRLVDIPMIFPLFHADENDPRNYYFEQTDDYIYNCLELGTNILYRLGTSIEHTRKKYFIYPPEDVDKWINICSNIIRHYTEGWARGFYYKWRVRYWEIWCEPDCGDGKGHLLLWQGSIDEYNKFYVKVATELKKRFPVLRFGGPGHISPEENAENFIKYCAKHQAPLDFYSYHIYAADPRSPRLIDSPAKIRKILDENGYNKTEIIMDEWHYITGGGPRMWSDYQYRRQIYAEMKSLNAAAFHNEVMTRWQDTPLDMGCLYTLTTGNYGLYEYRSNVPTKAYYGMKAFGEIVRYTQRLKTTSSHKNIVALAGINSEGKKALLISGFKVGPQTFRVSGLAPNSKIRVVDQQRNLEPLPVKVKNDKIEFECESDSCVVLITE